MNTMDLHTKCMQVRARVSKIVRNISKQDVVFHKEDVAAPEMKLQHEVHMTRTTEQSLLDICSHRQANECTLMHQCDRTGAQ